MNEISPISIAEPVTFAQFLSRVILDPNLPLDRVETVYRMHRETQADEARVRATEALNNVKAELRAIVKNKYNSHTQSKYADMEAVDDVIRPLYTRYGFDLSFTMAWHDERYWVQAILKHLAPGASVDHIQTFELPATPDTAGPKGVPNKTENQGTCSATTYLRRYLKYMIFDVATRDDNDGNRQQEAGPIGEAGIRLLYELLADCSANPQDVEANERAFLTKMGKPEFRTIRNVPPGHFVRFKNALLTKKAVLAERAAREAAKRDQPAG